MFETQKLEDNTNKDETLIQLVHTLHELSARLAVFSSMVAAGTPALRATLIGTNVISGNITQLYEGNVPANVLAQGFVNDIATNANINRVIP